jgi:glycine cleavage system transcriptional repressor
VPELAITVIGHDRPGIIAHTTEVLARLGFNLTDSTMTRLRGHFAMTLICTGDPTVGEVQAALEPMTADGSLVVTVRDVGRDQEPIAEGHHYILSLHGADRLGIVAAFTRVLADAGGNITDLSTRLVSGLYVLVAEVDLPSTVEHSDLEGSIATVARQLGVEAQLRPADADLL